MEKKKFNIRKFDNRVNFDDYEPLKPMEAIRAWCKECYCWDVKEMKQCDSKMCPFNQFLRNGFKLRKRTMTEEERVRKIEQAKIMRERKNKKV